MYCPNCGLATSTDLKFCRACGLSLEKAAQSLVEQLPTVEPETKLRTRKRTVDRLLYALGGSALAVLVVSIFWAVITQIMFSKGQVLGGSIFLAFILGIIVFALLMLYRESLAKTSGKLFVQPALTGAEPTGKLLRESQLEPVPSVTERTTELLAAEQKRKVGREL